jgi:hypothetical protein
MFIENSNKKKEDENSLKNGGHHVGRQDLSMASE